MAAQEVAQFVPRKFPDVRRLKYGGPSDPARAQVYFMVAAGLIKIGVSGDVHCRWGKLNLASPIPIDLIGSFPGTRAEERALHAKFKHLRRRGEWFEDAPELRAEIDRLLA